MATPPTASQEQLVADDHSERGCCTRAKSTLSGRTEQGESAGAGEGQKDQDGCAEGADICDTEHGMWAGLLVRIRAHPDEAAVCVQLRHGEMFHVKHIDVGIHGAQFVWRKLSLHRHPHAVWRQALPRKGNKVV